MNQTIQENNPMKLKFNRGKDRAKLRAKLNKIEDNKAIEKLLQLRAGSLKQLIKLIKEKKEKKTQTKTRVILQVIDSRLPASARSTGAKAPSTKMLGQVAKGKWGEAWGKGVQRPNIVLGIGKQGGLG